MADDDPIADGVDADDMRGGLDALADAAAAVEAIPDVVEVRAAGARRRRQPGDPATSAWIITLNTNRVPGSDAEAARIGNQLQYAARLFLLALNSPVDRWNYLYTIDGFPRMNDGFDVSVVARPEIGPRFHRLHQHMVVVIRHRTRIKIDTGKLLELYNRILEDGWSIPFIHIRTFNMAIDRVIDYIRKGEWYGQGER